jgi:hypothetical protein
LNLAEPAWTDGLAGCYATSRSFWASARL